MSSADSGVWAIGWIRAWAAAGCIADVAEDAEKLLYRPD
jgi:hypothetical protein